MEAFFVVFGELLHSPITVAVACVLVAVWVKVFHGRFDVRQFAYNYLDICVREVYWKALAAPFCHQSKFHVIINVITLWAIRDIERTYGSWFFLRYTVVLMLAEVTILMSMIAFILSVSGFTQIATIRQHPFVRNSYCYGFSSILLAWLAFQSVSDVLLPRPFFLIGILPVPWALAPLMMIFISPMYAPRFIGVTNGIGLLCGYLLGFGVLKILPDMYWTICFGFNVMLFLTMKTITSTQTRASAAAGSEDQTDDTAAATNLAIGVGPSQFVRSRNIDGNEILEIPAAVVSSSGASSNSNNNPDGTSPGDIELGGMYSGDEDENEDEDHDNLIAEGYQDDYFTSAQRIPLTGGRGTNGSANNDGSR